jgi:hypothetical protein
MSMRAPVKLSTCLLASALFFPAIAPAQNLSFREIETRIREYRTWLDAVGGSGSRFWVRLDSTKRPHRLYVGEGFEHANFEEKENFIEVFSRVLAGHPDKNMLIDIFDASSGRLIGEYGFGGFRLFN